MKHEIIPVKFADSFLREDLVYCGGDKTKMRPICFYVYVIKTGQHCILVDAGCETMPGFDMRNFISPIKALAQAGVTIEEITDVVLTHAHHDHVECVGYFPQATIHVQVEELTGAMRYIPDGFRIHTFDEGFSLCDGVEILKIGGHSRGSSIVTVQAQDTVYVIAGDECYNRECLEKRIPVGSSCSPERSRAFVEKYSDPAYTVLLMHDD